MRNVIVLLLVTMFLLTACDQATEQPAQPAATATATAEPIPTVAVSLEEGMQTFTIVSEESSASYIVNEELFQGALEKYNIPIGNAVITGSTIDVNGTLQIDLVAAELGESQFTVNLVSLVTGQNDRDGWIRDNALESNRYPTAVFTANELVNPPADYQLGQEATFQLVGDMTIRDITNPLTFNVTATLEGNTIQGFAEASSKMTDWGFEPPSFAGTLTVEDEFTIRVDFVARAQ